MRLLLKAAVVGPLVKRRRGITTAIFLLVAGVLFSTGALEPLQSSLEALRFRVLSRPPTGQITLVDIDAPSIQALGAWPWPRSTYARILDRLLSLGVAEVAFDVDFSSPSVEDQDASFEQALKRADGMVVVAALKQVVGLDADRRSVVLDTRPLRRFADNAWEASVNVVPDASGRIRWYPEGDLFEKRDREPGATAPTVEPVPSLASVLGEGSGRATARFLVDYGIDADRFTHVSVVDLLRGTVSPDTIRGRKVIVGATAIELRDYFIVPRFGFMNGPMVQAVATENLLQHRALKRVPTWPTLAICAALLALIGLAGASLSLVGFVIVCGAIALMAEAVATEVQWLWPIVPQTVPLHVALLGIVGIAILSEVHERRLKLQASRRQANQLRQMLDRIVADNFAGIVVIDRDGRIRAISDAATALLGRVGSSVIDQSFESFLPEELAALVMQARVHAAAGEMAEIMAEIPCPVPDGRIALLNCVATVSRPDLGAEDAADVFVTCLTFRDVTEQRRAQAQITEMARTDALSGLANRYSLFDTIKSSIAASDTGCTAVVLLDLDRFKVVNDLLGHAAGDELIRLVAARIQAAALPTDVAARLGGDEFAVVVSRGSLADVRLWAERLQQDLTGDYKVDSYHTHVSVSLGYACHTDQNADDLMRCADAALYAAKADGGGKVRFYDADLRTRLNDGKLLEDELREAVRKQAFSVVYQRQVDLRTQRITGVEALARWTPPGRAAISPAVFIPAAERTGLIRPIGLWVLRTACRDAMDWPIPIKVSVNLSAVQLAQADLADEIFGVLAQTGLPPERLDLELTESMLMEDGEAIRTTLDRLRAAGIAISLDDFGTGYSSLSYLKNFPVDKVKIDQTFVSALASDQSSAAIIRAVTQLARDLGMRVNAEGVETPEQLSLLRLFGCDEIQGFLFGRPEPTASLHAALLDQVLTGEGRHELRSAG